MKSFSNYIDSQDRQNKKKLQILNKIFTKAGFETESNINDSDEAHVYVARPDKIIKSLEKLSFGGIRLYCRGKTVCYRTQNKQNVEPYGNAYVIDVEGMYKELIGDGNKKIISYQVIYYIIKELIDFFMQSLEAERQEEMPGDSSSGKVMLGRGDNAIDYANMSMDVRNSR